MLINFASNRNGSSAVAWANWRLLPPGAMEKNLKNGRPRTAAIWTRGSALLDGVGRRNCLDDAKVFVHFVRGLVHLPAHCSGSQVCPGPKVPRTLQGPKFGGANNYKGPRFG